MNTHYIYTGIESLILFILVKTFINFKNYPWIWYIFAGILIFITIKDWLNGRTKPKFNEGDIVKHRISKKRYVIIDISPARWHNNAISYTCSNGKYNKHTETTEEEFCESELEMAK